MELSRCRYIGYPALIHFYALVPQCEVHDILSHIDPLTSRQIHSKDSYKCLELEDKMKQEGYPARINT